MRKSPNGRRLFENYEMLLERLEANGQQTPARIALLQLLKARNRKLQGYFPGNTRLPGELQQIYDLLAIAQNHTRRKGGLRATNGRGTANRNGRRGRKAV